ALAEPFDGPGGVGPSALGQPPPPFAQREARIPVVGDPRPRFGAGSVGLDLLVECSHGRDPKRVAKADAKRHTASSSSSGVSIENDSRSSWSKPPSTANCSPGTTATPWANAAAASAGAVIGSVRMVAHANMPPSGGASTSR